VRGTARLLKVSTAKVSEIRRMSVTTADLHSSINLLVRVCNEGALTRIHCN
jgi:hypothetical protein